MQTVSGPLCPLSNLHIFALTRAFDVSVRRPPTAWPSSGITLGECFLLKLRLAPPGRQNGRSKEPRGRQMRPSERPVELRPSSELRLDAGYHASRSESP